MKRLLGLHIVFWQLIGLALPIYYINLMLTRDGEIHFWTSVIALTVSGQSLMVVFACCTFVLLGERK